MLVCANMDKNHQSGQGNTMIMLEAHNEIYQLIKAWN